MPLIPFVPEPDGEKKELVLLASGVVALDPKTLESKAESAVRALLRQDESTNARASYGKAMKYWCGWYAGRYGGPLTLRVPVPVVLQFIVHHAERLADDDAGGEGAVAPKTKGRAKPRASRLLTEMPPELDQALVDADFKAQLGPPALNTLALRIAVHSKNPSAAGPRAMRWPSAPERQLTRRGFRSTTPALTRACAS